MLPFKSMPQEVECVRSECVGHSCLYLPTCVHACLFRIPVWRAFHGMLARNTEVWYKRVYFQKRLRFHQGSATWLFRLWTSELQSAYLWRIDLNDLKYFSSSECLSSSYYEKMGKDGLPFPTSPRHCTCLICLNIGAFCRDLARRSFLMPSPTPSGSYRVLIYGRYPPTTRVRGPWKASWCDLFSVNTYFIIVAFLLGRRVQLYMVCCLSIWEGGISCVY